MQIQTILKRGFQAVALLLVAVVAYLQGKGAGQLVGLASIKPAQRHSALPEPDATQAPPNASAPVKGEQAIRDRIPLCQPTLLRQAAPAPVPEPLPVTTPLQVAETPRPQASLWSQLRAVPEQKNGQIVGLRLFGIRQGSLLSTLGLRNGDRLEAINGFEIASPEKALQAYAQLRSASHLHVQLNRVGKPVQLDLNII